MLPVVDPNTIAHMNNDVNKIMISIRQFTEVYNEFLEDARQLDREIMSTMGELDVLIRDIRKI